MTVLSVTIAAHQLVDALVDTAFNRQRDPRSDVYKLGARSLLVSRATQSELTCYFRPGSVEFDAFFAGVDEGKAIWASHYGGKSQ